MVVRSVKKGGTPPPPSAGGLLRRRQGGRGYGKAVFGGGGWGLWSRERREPGGSVLCCIHVAAVPRAIMASWPFSHLRLRGSTALQRQ
jgi:hypothetical protein